MLVLVLINIQDIIINICIDTDTRTHKKKEAEFLWFQFVERAQILFYKPAAREICHPSQRLLYSNKPKFDE